MSTLLILGAGPMQVPAFHAARALGCRIVAADPSDCAEAYALADQSHVCDLTDIAACVSVARKHGVNGVLTLAADVPVPAVAAICEALGLAGLSVPAAENATNKAAMRRALRAASIAVPDSHLVNSEKAAQAAAFRVGGPVIVKPADSSGGRGVTLIESPDARNDVGRAFHRAIQFSRAGQVLIEEFVSGPEYSVEAITIRGRTRIVAVTDKVTTGPPYFVETGHSQPSQSSVVAVAVLCKLAVDAIAALGIDNSASHTEIRIGPAGPRVIEIGARLGGGYIASHLVPLSSGVDLVGAAICLALGEAPKIERRRQNGAAIRFMTPQPGRIQSIIGVEDARNVDGVRLVDIHKRPGDHIAPLLDATARVGYAIAAARDAPMAIRAAERARDLISFVMHVIVFVVHL